MKNDTVLRFGKVSGIEYETGMLQVVYTDKDNAVTAKMPYANFNNEYHMPGVGESVLVAHLSNGSSRGVVIGTVWNKKNIPAESGENLYRKELSREKGVAYTRYDDVQGEYLLKAPAIILQGIDRAEIEGPEISMTANISTDFESPSHTSRLSHVGINGLDGSNIDVDIKNDINITMKLSDLNAMIKIVKIETTEDFNIKAGTNITMESQENIGMAACGDIKLEDANYKTSLSAVLSRLEALDHDDSARK